MSELIICTQRAFVMSNLPEEIAAHVARAAEELAAAAAKIPSCDCEQMDPERMVSCAAADAVPVMYRVCK